MSKLTGKFKVLKQTKKGGLFVDIELVFDEDIEKGLTLNLPSDAHWYLDAFRSGIKYVEKYGRYGEVTVTKFLEIPTDTTDEIVEFAFIVAFQRALGIVLTFPYLSQSGEIVWHS
jgi:hypothetical protein